MFESYIQNMLSVTKHFHFVNVPYLTYLTYIRTNINIYKYIHTFIHTVHTYITTQVFSVVPKIHSYLAVLFVDSDILFNHKNLGGLISRVLDNPTKLHVYREGNFNARDFNHGFFGLGAFPVTTEEVTSFTPYHNFILTVHACIYAYTIVSLVLSVFHIPGYNIHTYLHTYIHTS
jgi:hypothetical protein